MRFVVLNKNVFLIGLSESERTDFGRIEFAAQPEEQKVFSAIWELESQINNGGFDQFFRNCDSDVIAFAPSALRTIGAELCAIIVDRAIAIINPLPSAQDDRSRALDAVDDEGQHRLAELDSEFFTYPDNLTEYLFEFVHKHPKAFGPIPNA